ncbi:hypothetical protein PR003_g31815 [Phytophthora rubi]|uniref:RxLR effector protein n=1 Tax=Phytophthora rubi TaxID=129364 RepID=A0A6A3GLJ6_9STRA|nr:hypothetical protein PR001_g30749 [Phytophthora rubi]KAE8959394.1 hypothetical protein PR002_g30554 [Phytophthora rubi]KAE9267326.1 hypothetical protein PR003_g31815 [Phytophthora rubi]
MTGKFKAAVRLDGVILVALAILLTFADALPVTTDYKMISVQQTFQDNSRYDQNTRHLRAHKHSLDDEERAFGVNIPVISKLADKMSKNPKSEVEVFKLFAKMQLVNAKPNLFENPQFLKWTSAVTKGYKDSQAADMAIAFTLARQHGDEGLAKMIVEAKKVSSTKDVAARLEEAQMKNWLSKKETADNVFRALKIEKDGYISLRNPLLGNWVTYVEKIEENPYKLLLSKMRERYSDDIIAGLVGSARGKVVGPSIAQKVEGVVLRPRRSRSRSALFKVNCKVN